MEELNCFWFQISGEQVFCWKMYKEWSEVEACQSAMLLFISFVSRPHMSSTHFLGLYRWKALHWLWLRPSIFFLCQETKYEINKNMITNNKLCFSPIAFFLVFCLFSPLFDCWNFRNDINCNRVRFCYHITRRL